jgi:hypothetical protein
MVSFPRIPTIRNLAQVLLALCLLPNLKICKQTESEQRGKNRKKSYDHCDTQQLEGETHDKSERVTSVSRVTKLIPARAYKEQTESKLRRNAFLITKIRQISTDSVLRIPT